MDKKSLLTDKKFKKGFAVRGLGLSIYDDEIENFGDKFGIVAKFQYGKKLKTKPAWRICQWASRFPFHDKENILHKNNYCFEQVGKGRYKYKNQSKDIEVDISSGELYLELRASECYKYPRTAGQEWPHLLIERDIGNMRHPKKLNKISDASKIVVNLDIKVDKYLDHMGKDAVRDIHAIIFIYYLFIANYNPRTKQFDDMIWFGLPLWDNRWAFTSLQSFPDLGTKASATDKWIYNNPTTIFFNEDYNLYTKDGKKIFNEWRNVSLDILPHIKKALCEAQSNGYMQNSKFENLYINGMYFGFESCGTYDAGITVKNIDIIKEKKL